MRRYQPPPRFGDRGLGWLAPCGNHPPRLERSSPRPGIHRNYRREIENRHPATRNDSSELENVVGTCHQTEWLRLSGEWPQADRRRPITRGFQGLAVQRVKALVRVVPFSELS